MKRLLLLLALFLAACSAAPHDAPSQITLRWEFRPDAASTVESPMTQTTLRVSGAMEKAQDLGAYAGSGTDIGRTAWQAPAGSEAAAIFWWAGGGDELSVTRTAPDTLTVRHRTIDEEAGYGEFTDKATISIPANATISVER